MKIKFKRAQGDDVETVNLLQRQSKQYWGYSDDFMNKFMDHYKFTTKQLEEMEMYFMLVNNKISGMYGFGINDNGDLQLDNFFMHPNYIGHGLGTVMWDQCIKTAMNYNKQVFIIEADPNAEKLYVKMGCYKINEIESPVAKRMVPVLKYKIMSRIIIKDYHEQDARTLAEIYYNTIHKINIKDYTQEQIDAWAPISSLEKLDGWLQKWSKLKPMVAVIDNNIVGFTEFNNNGYIDCFFCHHDWIGRGVGSALMRAIEDQAKINKISRVFSNVCVTARPFFEIKGFKLVREEMIEFRGVKLKNNVMEKRLD